MSDLSGIKWRESYNCHSLTLGPGCEINVNWNSLRPKGSPEPAGYKIGFLGCTLKRVEPDLDRAKAIGLRWAAQMLADLRDEAIDQYGRIQRLETPSPVEE